MSRRELSAAGITDPRLRADYTACRRLNAEHGRTYYLATLLLPPAKRPYVHALYGFARYADEIVDRLDPTWPAPDRAAEFERWSAQMRRDLEQGSSADPIGRAVIDTIRRWDLPLGYFVEFLDSMRMDLVIGEYETYADLLGYMRGSAAVIGLQMLPLLGRADEVDVTELADRASELGVAFQLTNFLRDIGEDGQRGRVYLPQESLRRFGLQRADLVRAVVVGGALDAQLAAGQRQARRVRRLRPGNRRRGWLTSRAIVPDHVGLRLVEQDCAGHAGPVALADRDDRAGEHASGPYRRHGEVEWQGRVRRGDEERVRGARRPARQGLAGGDD